MFFCFFVVLLFCCLVVKSFVELICDLTIN